MNLTLKTEKNELCEFSNALWDCLGLLVFLFIIQDINLYNTILINADIFFYCLISVRDSLPVRADCPVRQCCLIRQYIADLRDMKSQSILQCITKFT